MTNPFDPAAITSETAAFNARLEATLAEVPASHLVPPDVTRKARAEGKGVFPPRGPLPSGSEWVAIDGAQEGPGRVRVSAPSGDPVGLYLHIHGGGWTLGSPDLYDGVCQDIARATQAVVVSVAYRLAPEHVWPAQADDCIAAARWALGAWPGLGMVIGGESAGGHLAVVTLDGLRGDAGFDRIRGAVLNYGVYDLRMSPSARIWGDRQFILSVPTMQWFTENLGPGVDVDDPRVSPILMDLSGMPPALFQCGTVDPLLDDTLMLEARWRTVADTETAIYPGGIHAYDMFDTAIGRASQARQQAFIAQRLGR